MKIELEVELGRGAEKLDLTAWAERQQLRRAKEEAADDLKRASASAVQAMLRTLGFDKATVGWF